MVTYSDVQGGWVGAGNINLDPQFLDATGPDGVAGTADDNLRLNSFSPCFGVGNSSAVTTTTDLQGRPRVDGCAVDMGAYEIVNEPFGSPGPDPAVPDGGFGTRVRYLSFSLGAMPHRGALRVTIDAMPRFPVCEDDKFWVATPQVVTELSGSPGPTPSPSFNAALLRSTPLFRDWRGSPIVHVYGDKIVPSEGPHNNPLSISYTTYLVQAIPQGCSVVDESAFSEPVSVRTSKWGDIVRAFGQGVQNIPDGKVELIDYMSVINKFEDAPGTLSKTQTDLDPTIPNRIIDILDIIQAVDAFQGIAYPFAGPTGCIP